METGRYYLVSTEHPTCEDGKKEKIAKSQFLIFADNINEAGKKFKDQIQNSTFDYKVTKIVETKILEVITAPKFN